MNKRYVLLDIETQLYLYLHQLLPPTRTATATDVLFLNLICDGNTVHVIVECVGLSTTLACK